MLVELDFFALNLALPDMARELETTTANLQWVISGYMLALAAFLIPGGAGLALLVAFVLRERYERWPLVDLELFRNRRFVVVTLMATVANVAFVVATFSITIFLQQVQGYTALEAGVIFLAASAAAGAAGPLSRRLGERFNTPITIAVATVIGSTGLLVLSPESDLVVYIPALAVFGIGYGTGWAMASVGTQTVVPPEEAGAASGVTLTIVIGIAGLALAAAAMLIEVGSGSSTGLGESIETLLPWVAIGAAVAAAALAILATSLDRRGGGAGPQAG